MSFPGAPNGQSDLNAKPQKPFLPQRLNPPELLSVIGRFFASSVCSKAVLFVFNVTCDIWPGLSALFVSHCVELNESFFQISYRDALCETIETPLRALNQAPGPFKESSKHYYTVSLLYHSSCLMKLER